ncbi:MAG: hypothetical protein Q8M56_09975 [Desulfobacterales bacterium]|nr:hypothetical protein [Desulfobacterales bacterium]
MNKAEWKLVTDALAGVYGRVELEVDGFEVALHRGQISKNRLTIMTYVNGQFLGKWFSDAACREGDFLRPTSQYIYPRKLRNDMKRLRKRSLKKMCDKAFLGSGHAPDIDYDKTIKSRSPFWGSVSTIRKHYEKTFKSIKLIKINGQMHEGAGG